MNRFSHDSLWNGFLYRIKLLNDRCDPEAAASSFSFVEPVASTKPKFPMTENSRTYTTYTVQRERPLTLPCPAQAFPVPSYRYIKRVQNASSRMSMYIDWCIVAVDRVKTEVKRSEGAAIDFFPGLNRLLVIQITLGSCVILASRLPFPSKRYLCRFLLPSGLELRYMTDFWESRNIIILYMRYISDFRKREFMGYYLMHDYTTMYHSLTSWWIFESADMCFGEHAAFEIWLYITLPFTLVLYIRSLGIPDLSARIVTRYRRTRMTF